MVATFKKMVFTGEEVNPCIFMQKSKKGTVFISLYVDNNWMIRDKVS